MSSGGQFTLEDKRGKRIALGGSQDFTSHAGHTVTVHGSYANGSDASGAAYSSNRGMASGVEFMVSKLDVVSEKCGALKPKNKDMNRDPNGKPSPYRN